MIKSIFDHHRHGLVELSYIFKKDVISIKEKSAVPAALECIKFDRNGTCYIFNVCNNHGFWEFYGDTL